MYSTEGFDQWFKAKNFTTPLNEWNKLTTNMCRRIAQQNLEIIGENVSRFSDQLKRFSNVKKPEDFLGLQKECFDENLKANMQIMQKFIEKTLENVEEFTEACSDACQETMTGTTKTSERERDKR